MPKKISEYYLKEQPINWGRTIVAGAISALFMATFIDIFYLIGITPFSFEIYLGTLLRGTQYGLLNWVAGLFANLIVGSLFGVFYGYCFEYIFLRSSARIGLWIGFWHTLAAGCAVFPFFGAIHEFMNTGLYPKFGFLGASLSAATFFLIIFAHLLFGLCMGTFYGPVRLDRVLSQTFEPGETGLTPEEGGISKEEDPEDRMAV